MTQQLIDKYQLEPHPEGGFYRQVYASDHKVTSPINGAERHAATHIYFLLRQGEVSRFHAVDHDEIWHHYAGSPINLIQLDGARLSETTLGGPDGHYIGIVKSGVYQAAESTGEYSLVGCTVAPGFDFEDFRFADSVQVRSTIITHYTEYQRFL